MIDNQCNRRHFLKAAGLGCAAAITATGTHSAFAAQTRPNILNIFIEDTSPYFTFYGDLKCKTPAIDAFAAESIIYKNALTTVAVCAPCRASMGPGLYATSIGAHNMRGSCDVPDEYKHFGAYLRDAGYYTVRADKQDSQGAWNGRPWDLGGDDAKANLWNGRGGKPFYVQWSAGTLTHEGKFKHLSSDKQKPPAFPPYLVDNETSYAAMNHMYEQLAELDTKVNELLAKLKNDGLENDTIVIFTADHGCGMPRHKRWVYDSGLRVPFVVRVPEKFRRPGKDLPGTTTDELVSFIDLAPTFLNLAGVKIPSHMQGRAFLGENLTPERQYIFGSRDRMDERYECIRGVRSKKYKYIRNFKPWIPYFAYHFSSDKLPLLQELRKAQQNGTLPEAAKQYFSGVKPYEELYDIEKDPHEINNIASRPENKATLTQMRAALHSHMIETRDLGLMPECEILALRKTYSTEWEIVRQGSDNPVEKWLDAIAVTEKGTSGLDDMIALLENNDSVIRYWACLGIGNLGSDGSKATAQLQTLLSDEAASVKIAAARALYYINKSSQALDTLENIAKSGVDYADLLAANVLDAIGADGWARIEKIKGSLTGKYTERIALYYGKEPYPAPPFNFGNAPGVVNAKSSVQPFRRNAEFTARYQDNVVHIHSKTPLHATLKLFGSRGRLITRTRIAGSRNVSVPCGDLAPGIYTVVAEPGAGAVRRTFSVL